MPKRSHSDGLFGDVSLFCEQVCKITEPQVSMKGKRKLTDFSHEDTAFREVGSSEKHSKLPKKNKICIEEGCSKQARSGGKCSSHGGGKRCIRRDCGKGAVGNTLFCIAHGGGKRCKYDNCGKSAVDKTLFCIEHGGGKRCKYDNCGKSARSKTLFCVEHGGGKRCNQNCGKSAIGNTLFCVEHGALDSLPWIRCEICEYKTKTKTQLKIHKMFAHDINVVWQACDVQGCEATFKSRCNLTTHIRSVHNAVYASRRKIQEERVRKALIEEGWKEWFSSDTMPPVGYLKREHRIDFDCLSSSL